MHNYTPALPRTFQHSNDLPRSTGGAEKEHLTFCLLPQLPWLEEVEEDAYQDNSTEDQESQKKMPPYPFQREPTRDPRREQGGMDKSIVEQAHHDQSSIRHGKTEKSSNISSGML